MTVGAGWGYAWTGFNDRLAEGSFVWSSGDPVTYTNWAGGEPNDMSGEDCAHIQEEGTWNDANCSVPLPPIPLPGYVCSVPSQ
jgi:hypothetical protein